MSAMPQRLSFSGEKSFQMARASREGIPQHQERKKLAARQHNDLSFQVACIVTGEGVGQVIIK